MIGRYFFIGVVALGLFVYVRASDGAAQATITQVCDGSGTAAVTFAWRAPKDGAQQAWLDVSPVEGFFEGWYQAHGPLPPAETQRTLAALPVGLRFHYRVNTQYADGWRASARGSFVAGCGATPTPAAAGN